MRRYHFVSMREYAFVVCEEFTLCGTSCVQVIPISETYVIRTKEQAQGKRHKLKEGGEEKTKDAGSQHAPERAE